jgi:hypothetical protein
VGQAAIQAFRRKQFSFSFLCQIKRRKRRHHTESIMKKEVDRHQGVEKDGRGNSSLTKMNVVFNQLRTSYLLKISINNNKNGNINTNDSNNDNENYNNNNNNNQIHVPFGIHNLRKKTATVMSTLLAQGKITFEDYNNFVLSELHDVDTSERYYVEQVWGPNRMRPILRRVLYSGSIEEIVKNRSEHIKKGYNSFIKKLQ